MQTRRAGRVSCSACRWSRRTREACAAGTPVPARGTVAYRQPDGAVLVRVLQTRVHEDRSASTVKLLFEFFFGYSRGRHRQLLSPGRTRSVKFLKRLDGAGGWGRKRCASRRVVVDRPARRPLPAVDASQEDIARFARDAELVLSRQVAANQIPHRKRRLVYSRVWGTPL